MPVPITRYVVLLSSPGDAKPYCDIAREAIESINRTHSGPAGVELYTTDWRRDSVADSGAEPQALLNKQIVDDADVVLAIFNERFGTPTKNYGSGTEEEIRLGLESGKRVMVYFRILPKDLAPSPDAQPDEIAAFRNSLGQSALYKFFSGEADFEATITHDFESLVSELEHVSVEPKPSLSVASVDRDDSLSSGTFKVIPSLARSLFNANYLDGEIRDAYNATKTSLVRKPELKPLPPKQEEPGPGAEENGSANASPFQVQNALANVKLPENAVTLGKMNFGTNKSVQGLAEKMASLVSPYCSGGFAEPVTIPAGDIEIVTQQLGQLGLKLDDDLFYLGNLTRSTLSPATPWSPAEFYGTEDEKEKHKRVSRLVSLCKRRFHFQAFLASYENIGGVAFTLENSGEAPAHHVRVEIRIPSASFIRPECAPLPSDYFIGRVLDEEADLDRFAERLLTPGESSSYRSYEDSIAVSESGHRARLQGAPRVALDPFNRRHLDRDDFTRALNYIYGDFSFVEDHAANETVISIEFDRVQHGSAYAFPAYLLVRSDLAVPISYRITADEQRSPIVGELTALEKAG